MNVKKAVKRIAALAAGTTMVTATIMGAMATDLSDYPEPFVQNGVFNGLLVVGRSAKVSDVLGAIDIAASLQAEAKSPVEVGGSSSTVSVTGGVELVSGSDDLLLGESINSTNSGKYDDADFPDLLADNTVEDDDGAEYDYHQYINVPGWDIVYVQQDPEAYGTSDPFFALDTQIAPNYIEYVVDFDDELDLSGHDDTEGLTDSETIDLFGKTYTFDPDHAESDDITLYGSDVTVVVNQDEPVTVEVDGEEYTVEVLGGNSDASTVNLRVTGQGTETKSLEAGDSKTMAGLDVYVDDVFISNIGGDSISVSIFVGSNKIVIPEDSITTSDVTDTDFNLIQLNGEDLDGVEAAVQVATDLDDIQKIHFRVDPGEFTDPITDDDYEYLMMGEEFTDPLFGFSIAFESLTPDIESRPAIEVERSGDAYQLNFENNDGDEYSVEIIRGDGSDLDYEDLKLNVAAADMTLAKNDIFILNEGNGDQDDVTKFYEVTKINNGTSASDKYVSLKDLASGTTNDYQLNDDEIGDSGVTVDQINAAETAFSLSAATDDRIVFMGGMNLTLPDLSDGNITKNLTFYEDADDMDDATADSLIVSVSTDSDDDVKMGNADWQGANAVDVNDDDADYRYGMSQYGTWYEEEIDNNGDYLRIYYTDSETKYNVFLNGPDAVVVTTSGSSDDTAYQINEFVVGQIAVYDDEAMSLIGQTPLIVVGGPCVNTVAMSLMGNPEVCAEGFTDGKGMIKLYSSQNALLVAGYSGEDTTGAAYVLADYDSYDLSGDEVEVIVTDLENLEVNSVA